MCLISHKILKEKKVTYICILYYVNVDNFTRSIKSAFVMKGQSNISLHAYIADTYYCAEAAFMTTIQPQMKASFAVEVSTRLSRNKNVAEIFSVSPKWKLITHPPNSVMTNFIISWRLFLHLKPQSTKSNFVWNVNQHLVPARWRLKGVESKFIFWRHQKLCKRILGMYSKIITYSFSVNSKLSWKSCRSDAKKYCAK